MDGMGNTCFHTQQASADHDHERIGGPSGPVGRGGVGWGGVAWHGVGQGGVWRGGVAWGEVGFGGAGWEWEQEQRQGGQPSSCQRCDHNRYFAIPATTSTTTATTSFSTATIATTIATIIVTTTTTTITSQPFRALA